MGVLGSAAIAAPTAAEVPLTRAQLQESTNQVTLVTPTGSARPATAAACLCPGDRLSTSDGSQAEVLFNDGSLVRVGEQASLQFLPLSRRLTLHHGTVAVFVPPGQGRTVLQTPNATVGLNSSGVVVRYVPSRGLTLVMALANSATGPISVTLGYSGQEIALAAGRMALVAGGSVQVVEFDLREFYQTSSLMAGLNLADPSYLAPADEPLAALRPELWQALRQQPPFGGQDAVLDPALITEVNGAFGAAAPEAQPLPEATPTEDLRQDSDTPAGVVTPLPDNP
jgi:acrosin